MKHLKKIFTAMFCLCIMTVLVTGCGDKKAEEEETNGGSSDVNFLDNNDNYFFKIDGKTYKAGDKISTLSKSGYKLRDTDKDETVPAGKYMIGAGYMTTDGKTTSFDVTPFNTSNSDAKISDSAIGGLSLTTAYAKNDKVAMNIEVYGGIKLGSSMDDVKNKFGEPTTTSEGTGYTSYKYNSSEVYRSFSIRFDENKVVSSIEWKNLVFND